MFIDNSDTSVTLQGGTQVTGNTSTFEGGGIRIESDAQLTLIGSGTAITGNTNAPSSGGGISIRSGADVTLRNGAAISYNTGSTSSGAGVFLSGSGTTLTVDASSIIGNTGATTGGGIFAQTNATVTIRSGSLISENTSTNNGGGIMMLSSAGVLNVTDSTISHNDTGGNGDAVLTQGAEVNISNSCIVCNGDFAMSNTGSTPMTLDDNWWGSEWGPYFSGDTSLSCSAGDSLRQSVTETLSDYGITVTTPISSCYGSAPAGNWLTSPTAGCDGSEISEVSSLGHARTCNGS